ncbi:MAG: exodeoxyribonuclease large subunit [Actinomycetota bacterium]
MVRDSSPELLFGDEDGETFSVSEFVKTVNQSIKQRFGRGVWLHGEIRGVWLHGEIQELKTPSHVYFTLVDQDGDKKAVLSASIWQGVYSSMRTKLADSGLQLADGLKVRVFGEPDLYAGNGRFSFKVSKIDKKLSSNSNLKNSMTPIGRSNSLWFRCVSASSLASAAQHTQMC